MSVKDIEAQSNRKSPKETKTKHVLSKSSIDSGLKLKQKKGNITSRISQNHLDLLNELQNNMVEKKGQRMVNQSISFKRSSLPHAISRNNKPLTQK